MEIAVFGHSRNEEERRRELNRPPDRLGRLGRTVGGQDISQTGFRLVAPMSAASAVTLNTLAAIRPIGHAFWTLGIVRRMKRLTSDRAEIGLQVIANTLVGVELVEQKKGGGGDSDYSVEGEHSTLDGRVFAGLFLAVRKRGRNRGASLSCRRSTSRRAASTQRRSTVPVRFGRLIEQYRLSGPRSNRSTRQQRRALRDDDVAGMPAPDLALRGVSSRLMVDRAEIHRAFRWNVPASFVSRRRAARAGRAIARFAPHWEDESARRPCSFWDLERDARQLASALAALGVGRGDRVALMLPQRPETVIAHMAVTGWARWQAAVVPVRPRSAGIPADAQRSEGRHRRSAVAANLAPIRDRVPGVKNT